MIAAGLAASMGSKHGDLNVAFGIEMGQQIVQLKHMANLDPSIAIEVPSIGKVDSLEAHAATRGLINCGEQLQERGLPRA